MVNNGYAVLDINNRGSSGYGKTFQTLDDQAHGKGDLDDCVAAIDWLKSQNHIDGENIGILGGFKTLAEKMPKGPLLLLENDLELIDREMDSIN